MLSHLKGINIVNKVKVCMCFKNTFSSILSWNDQNTSFFYKIVYLINHPFSRNTLITSKKIHFYVVLIGNRRCQSQNARLRVSMQRNFHLIFYCFSKKYCWNDEEWRLQFICISSHSQVIALSIFWVVTSLVVLEIMAIKRKSDILVIV
jgi:hypothetical protein